MMALKALDASAELEINVVRRSLLERTFRLDAEYFQLRLVRTHEALSQLNRRSVTELASVSDGNHFTISDDFVDDGVPYYRGQDVVGQIFIENAEPVHITPDAFNRTYMVRSHLQKGDVLLSIVGTIGELSLVSSDKPATCSCKLAILRPHAIAPALLAMYLRSDTGQSQIERLTRGAVQRGLILEDMDQLWIPTFTRPFEAAIVDIVEASRALQTDAALFREGATDILMDELGLKGWSPADPLTYQASTSTVFESGRWDAQYYRPRYAEVQERLLATGNASPLGALLDVIRRGRQPAYSDDGTVVINSRHVRTNRVVIDASNRLATPNAGDAIVLNGDVLLNGTGVGTLGRSAPYLHEAPALLDNHITLLRSADIDPVFLSAFLNSPLGQLQIEQQIKGSSGQIEIYPADISRILVWKASTSTQERVRKAILEAFSLAREAERLITAATTMVDCAVLDGEAVALSLRPEF